MQNSQIIVIICLVVLAIFIVKKFKALSTPQNFERGPLRPYIAKPPLTPTEVLFYKKLIDALPELLVFPQVQLSSFIKVDFLQVSPRDNWRYFNPISRQSVDYLICKSDFTILAAVELDDKSHLADEAIQRDAKKTSNLMAARIPLIRWHAERMPSNEVIQLELQKLNHPQIDAEPEHWLPDGPAYLREGPNLAKYGLIILMAAVVIVWGIVGALKLSTPKNDDVQKQPSPLTQLNQPASRLPIDDIFAKQKLAQQNREAAARAARLAEEQRALEIKQQMILAAQEAALKEDTWNRYYKKSIECENTGGLISCGNDYARNRKRFEQDWAKRKQASK